MKLILKYPKKLCIFALHQTPPYLDLACPQASKDPIWKDWQNFLILHNKYSHLSESFQFWMRLEKDESTIRLLMLNNDKTNKFHSISNKFTDLSQFTKNKIKNAKSKF